MQTLGTVYRVARSPMRSSPKKSRDHLPLRRAGRRTVHFTDVRRDPEATPRKTNYFCHGRSVSEYHCAFRRRGFGIRERIMDLVFLYAWNL